MIKEELRTDSMAKEEEIKPDLNELRKMMKKKGKDFYKDPRIERDVLPTGYLTLDDMLSGGLRAGVHVELFGEQSTGKTYLALEFMKQCQQIWKKPVCYVNFEKSWYPDRAAALGLNLDPDWCELIEPPTQEDGYDFMKLAVQTDIYGVIVVDSMSAMVPSEEIEEDLGKANVAKGARNNSKGLRVITSQMTNTIIVFVNQFRDTIGGGYGDTRTTTGGKALGFYASTRLQIDKITREKEEQELYSAKSGKFEKTKVVPGHIMKIRLKKSRVGKQDDFCELVYDYDISGIDRVEDKKAYMFNHGLLERVGVGWYKIKGIDDKIQGKKGLYEFIRDNEELIDKVIREVDKE